MYSSPAVLCQSPLLKQILLVTYPFFIFSVYTCRGQSISPKILFPFLFTSKQCLCCLLLHFSWLLTSSVFILWRSLELLSIIIIHLDTAYALYFLSGNRVDFLCNILLLHLYIGFFWIIFSTKCDLSRSFHFYSRQEFSYSLIRHTKQLVSIC
jgi:hypothetical protein